MTPRFRSRFLVVGLLISALFGCDDSRARNVVVTRSVQTTPAVAVAPSTLMDSSDLDLSTIAELIRSGRVSDAETLQSTVNDPQNALNNVDLDKDGNIDPITVTEVATATGKQFNLVANPATQAQVPVANINMTLTGSQVVVNAGYPSYVRGYDTNYYTYSVARDLAFMSWAMGPRPLFVARPYSTYGWYSSTPRPVYGSDVVTQRRTSYTTQTHVSPVPRSAPPPAAVQQAQATKVPSGFQTSASARPTPMTNNLNDRGTTQNFAVRDTARPVAQATGFGARTSTPSPAPVPTPQRIPTVSSPPPAAPSPPPSRPTFSSPAPTTPRTSPVPSPPSSPRPSFSGGGSSRSSFSSPSSRPSAPRTSTRR
jgi:hypothetical protein